MKFMAGVGSVRSRIDRHCTPITTVQCKKHRLRLTKRVRARPPSTFAMRSPQRHALHVDVQN